MPTHIHEPSKTRGLRCGEPVKANYAAWDNFTETTVPNIAALSASQTVINGRCPARVRIAAIVISIQQDSRASHCVAGVLPPTVTQEVASSSLVGPAIVFNQLRTAPFQTIGTTTHNRPF